MEHWQSKTTDRLVNTLLKLESPEEGYALLTDLCTVKEIKDMAQRLEVALLLKEGKSYQEISADTGVSAATISRVSRCLNYGSGGYTKALEKMEEQG